MEAAFDLQAFLTPIAAVVELFSRSGRPGTIVGGIAIAIIGKDRPTGDVDALILADNQDFEKLLQIAAELGLTPRNQNPIEFAKRHRIFLFRHLPSGIEVDLAVGALPFEAEKVKRSRPVTVLGVTFPVPTPEDMVISKAIAGRSKDISDIEHILRLHPDLSTKRIRSWVQQFAELLERPEILTDLEILLKKNLPPKSASSKNSRSLSKRQRTKGK
jgi:hypothetical protein